jgi:SET domain-containing protein
MTKEKLLKELSQETYAALKPSGVHGIGVFAIRAIPKGCRTIFAKGVGEWIKVVPDYGFKVIDIVNYLNHSSSPNIISVNDGEEFEALRDIPSGAELLLDYKKIAEGLDAYE